MQGSISECTTTRNAHVAFFDCDTRAGAARCLVPLWNHGYSTKRVPLCCRAWWLDYHTSRVHLELSFLGHLKWHQNSPWELSWKIKKKKRRRGGGRWGSKAFSKIHCGAGNHRLNTDRMKERGGRVRERRRNRGRSEAVWSHMYPSHMSLDGWMAGWDLLEHLQTADMAP